MSSKLIILFSLLVSTMTFSQFKEGQNFCDASNEGSYFPLGITEKKILWSDTHYVESIIGTKELNGHSYIEFEQKWKDNSVSTIYLREENGIVYQYEECCEEDTVRYNPEFQKGREWKTADGLGTYEVLTFDGELETPFCKYKNLLIIQARLKNGTFNFYYYKGHGYIGASINNQLISCVTPVLKTE